MSTVEDRIRHLLGSSIESKIALADTLSPTIAKSAAKLVDCLLNERKILVCGQGASAANCLHFSAAMLNSFGVDRPPLPAMVLSTDQSLMTAMAQNGGFDQIFARQIQALGQEGDVLLLLTTSGNSDAMIQAVQAAKERGIDTVALSGRDGGPLASRFGPDDIEIRVQAEAIAEIREMHLFILHCFCDLIDQSLFGTMAG